MQLNITFRHLDSSDSLKQYAQEKVGRIHKYIGDTGEAHIVLSLERHLHHADITLRSGQFFLRGSDKSPDMYASIDVAVDKIERQFKRYKEKLKHHHGRDRVHHGEGALKNLKVRYDVLDVPEPEKVASEESPHSRVVRTNEFLVKPMNLDEAVMQMDLMNNDFFVFTNADSHEMNVLYRRKDGHFGLIEASASHSS